MYCGPSLTSLHSWPESSTRCSLCAWRGLVALVDEVQDAVSAQGVGGVLDPGRRGFGDTQGVDAEQVGQGAVVDGEGLGDLEEPDQFPGGPDPCCGTRRGEPSAAPRSRPGRGRWT